MRKIIISTFISLDGVIDNPMWTFDYFNEDQTDMPDYINDQLFDADTLVMGRLTYEGFAEAWSARAGADEFADRMNALPKYVASRTTTEPLTWNANLIEGDVGATIKALKEQPGQNILQYGCGELTYTMLKHGLVDEFRLMVFPLTVGTGGRLLENLDTNKFNLLETKSFKNGVVALHYQPVTA